MKKHLKTTWFHIRRSPYQTLSAVLILFLTFLISSFFVLTTFGSQAMLHYFETRPQVTAFLKDDTTPEKVDEIKAALAQNPKVKSVTYISKEEALSIYQEQNKNDPLLLEMVTANILPASLEISATDIAYLKEIAESIKTQSGVEEVIFQEDVVRALDNWTTTLRWIGGGLVGILGLLSLMTILIIIGMKIAIRKDEIEIIQLLGGSSWYIWAPFLFEGMFYGVVGAFLGWGLSYLILLYLTPILVNFFSGISLLPVPLWIMGALLGAEILAGCLIGALGSFIAVRRYLK